MIRPLFTLGLVLLYCSPLQAQDDVVARRDPNNVILSVLHTMPSGGGYSATSGATRDLQSAVQVSDGSLHVRPTAARATYCSGATYLVFIQAIQRLLPNTVVRERVAEALAINGQPDGVGMKEHGHSVIYLGSVSLNGVETIQFWSSNKPGGYGIKQVPRSRVFHAIFSRLEAPSNIEGSVTLPRKNGYLAGLITKESSISEALTQSGITR